LEKARAIQCGTPLGLKRPKSVCGHLFRVTFCADLAATPTFNQPDILTILEGKLEKQQGMTEVFLAKK